jgi:hypothetical protein
MTLGAPTSDTSPTESSDACGTTNNNGSDDLRTSPLDKGASDSPEGKLGIGNRSNGSVTRDTGAMVVTATATG